MCDDTRGKVYCDGSVAGFERTLNAGADAYYTFDKGIYWGTNTFARNLNSFSGREAESIFQLHGNYYGCTFKSIKMLQLLSKSMRYIYPKSVSDAIFSTDYPNANPTLIFSKYSLRKHYPDISPCIYQVGTKMLKILSFLHVYGGNYSENKILTDGPIHFHSGASQSWWIYNQSPHMEINARFKTNFSYNDPLIKRY